MHAPENSQIWEQEWNEVIAAIIGFFKIMLDNKLQTDR